MLRISALHLVFTLRISALRLIITLRISALLRLIITLRDTTPRLITPLRTTSLHDSITLHDPTPRLTTPLRSIALRVIIVLRLAALHDIFCLSSIFMITTSRIDISLRASTLICSTSRSHISTELIRSFSSSYLSLTATTFRYHAELFAAAKACLLGLIYAERAH